MRLLICNNCAIVLDGDALEFPDIELDDGTVDTARAKWNGDKFIAKVPCPVCGGDITEED